MVPRSNVTGPKLHGHAHLPLMGSPQAQISHISINTLGTGASTRIPRSRSWIQGQRSQDQNFMPMYIYASWVAHMHKQETLASMHWAQEHPQESQGQFHGFKVVLPWFCIFRIDHQISLTNWWSIKIDYWQVFPPNRRDMKMTIKDRRYE